MQGITEVLLRNPDDHVKVKNLMSNKEKLIAVVFDDVSLQNLNLQGIMGAIQDYLIIYGYQVKEYGVNNTEGSNSSGYLYERLDNL